MAQREAQAFQEELQRIEALLGRLEAIADPAARASAEELVQSLMDLHGSAIDRMMEIAAEAGAAGDAIIENFARDELVSGMLLLYGLHPLDLGERVREALDKVRPYLQSHGGNVELVGVSDDGIVRLRLQGSCHGCPSSAMTLKLAIEEAIYASAPDVTMLDVEGVVEQRPRMPASGIIPLEPIAASRTAAASTGWQPVDDVVSLGRGLARTIDVSGRPVLFCRVDEAFYAYSASCPACGQKLATAQLEATALGCPACGQRFDVLRAGRGLDEPSLYLQPFPLLVEHGQAQVALPI